MTHSSITLLYFAKLGEDLGLESEQFPLAEPTTLGELKIRLSQRGEQWQRLLEGPIKCAINQVLGEDSAPLKNGDEVAFFPPVTGG